MTDDRTDTPPPPTPEERSRQLVPVSAQSSVLAILPTNIDEGIRYAKVIIASGVVPDSFRYRSDVFDTEGKAIIRKGDANPNLILMGIMKSMEVGLPPQTGLNSLLVVNDRLSIWGDGAVALVQSKNLITNHQARVVGPMIHAGLDLNEWPPEHGWEVSFWRKGQESAYTGRFTVADAKRAGLWMNTRKEPWLKYPDRMLFNRARAFALRDGFADALAGLSIAEEMMDVVPDYGDEVRHAPATYLGTEPVTEEPKVITHEPTVDQAAEPELTRDLGGAADLKDDF